MSIQSEDRGEPSYTFKPSVTGTPLSFRLRANGLEWSRGRHTAVVPYRDIARLRLSYRPVTMQNSRYQLDLWAPRTPRLIIASANWRSMVEMESQLPAFHAFVLDLHQRIAAAGGKPRCETGLFAPLYWVGALTFAATSLGIAVLIVRALQVRAWAGAAFITAFLAVFLWQAGQFFHRNRPGTYLVSEPPAVLLPKS